MAKRKRKRKRKAKDGDPKALPTCVACEQEIEEDAQACVRCADRYHAACWSGIPACACGQPAGAAGPIAGWLSQFSDAVARPTSAALLLVGLAIATYFLSLWVPFLFDDAPVVTRNRMLWSWDGVWELLKFKPTRYLTNLTFLFNVKLAHWGTVPPIHGGIRDTWTYHVYSIGTHALNGVLLFTLVRDLLRARRDLVPANMITLVALAGAAVWVAHPANTMAVAYIAQRYALMAALAFFGTLIFYVRLRIHMEATGSKPLDEWPRYALVLAGVILALTTKENAAILPLAIVAIEILIFRGRWLVFTGVFFLPVVLGAVVFIGVYDVTAFVNHFLPAKSPTATRFEYFVTQIPVTLRYLHLWLLPHDLSVEQAFPFVWSELANNGDGGWYELIKRYPGHAPPESQAPDLVLLAVLGHALIMAFVAKLVARGHRFIPLAIYWFYITNIVESSIIPILDPMVDHRMYLPLALLPAAVAVAVVRSLPKLTAWYPRARTVVGAAAILLVLILAGGTVRRIYTWTSPTGIWEDTLEKRPDCARAWSSLGMESLYKQDWMGAIGPIETAVRLGPYHVEGWNNLGKAYLELQQWKAAEEALQRGIEINNTSPSDSVRMCWNNVGLVYLQVGRREKDPDRKRGWLRKAEFHLQKAIDLDPLYETAYANKAEACFVLMQMADTEGERQQYAKTTYEAVLRARKVAHMRGYELRLSSHRKLVFALLELDQAQEAMLHLMSLEERFTGEYRPPLIGLMGDLALAASAPRVAGGSPAQGSKEIVRTACDKIDGEMQRLGPGANRLLITRAELADISGDRQLAIRLYQAGLQADPGHPRYERARRRLTALLSGQ